MHFSIKSFGASGVRASLGGLAIALMTSVPGAEAHPHVFVDTAVIVYHEQEKIVGLEPIWIFDDLYSETLIADLDLDRDGQLSDQELYDFAGEALSNLKEWNYFLEIEGLENQGRIDINATRIHASIQSGRLVLRFLVEPESGETSLGEAVQLKMFDPSYFIAMDFVQSDQTVSYLPASAIEGGQARAVSGADADCRTERKAATGVDEQTRSLLEAIPIDGTPDNPRIGAAFAETMIVDCRG